METKEEKKYTIKDSIKEIIPYIIIILVVVLIRTFIVTPIKVNGTSMNNTLENGDTMILNKIDKTLNGLNRYDIVVIKTSNSYLIKRIIGLPGETISYKDGKLYINEKVIEDPYYKNDNTEDFDPVIIPDNEYYVMGDNRNNSIDSRKIGTINNKDILGTTKLIIFPISNIGLAK